MTDRRFSVRSLVDVRIERQEDAGDLTTIGGVVVPWGTESRLWGNVYERWERGSVPPETRTDARLMVGHDHSRTIANVQAGTMDLTDTERGLEFEARVDTRDTDAANAVLRLERGDIGEMSIGFTMQGGDEERVVEKEDGEVKRVLYTIKRIGRMFEASLLPFGALDGTKAELRSGWEAREARAAELQGDVELDTVRQRVAITRTMARL